MSTDHLAIQVQSRGIAFQPDSAYLELLKSAGASRALLDLLPHTVNAASATLSSPGTDPAFEKLAAGAKAVGAMDFASARKSLASAAELRPDDPDLLFALGGIFKDLGDWEHAAQVNHQAVGIAPDFLDAHLAMSYACYRLYDADCAEAESRLAVQRRPNDAEAHKDLGLAHSLEHDQEGAAREFREAIRLKPDYADAYYDLGNALHDSKDLDGSAAAYQEAIRLNSKNWKVYYNLGLTLNAEGDYAGSIAAYRKAKELDPTQLEVRQNLGVQLCETARYEESVKELRELLVIDPEWNMVRGCLGKSLFFTGHVDDAIVEYRKAIQDDPSDEMSRLGLGIALMDGKKQYPEALAQFQQAELYHPDSALPHWNLGRLFFQQSHWEESSREIAAALKIDPKNTRYMGLLAWDYEGLKRYDRAQGILEQIIELDKKTLGEASPQVAKAQAELAQVLGSQGKYDQAKPLYAQAIQTLRQNPESTGNVLQTVLNNYQQLLRDESAHNSTQAKPGPQAGQRDALDR